MAFGLETDSLTGSIVISALHKSVT